jgi:Holliday junction resolvase RusA-like endonuclease
MLEQQLFINEKEEAAGAHVLLNVALPFPPNTNHMYRRAGQIMYLTPQARHYKEYVVKVCRTLYPAFMIPSRTPLELELVLYCPANKINTLDWDGHIKAVQDAVFEASLVKANDAWIRRATVEKRSQPNNVSGTVSVILKRLA